MRLGFAFAGSALLHLLGASALGVAPGAFQLQDRGGLTQPLTVRIAPLPRETVPQREMPGSAGRESAPAKRPRVAGKAASLPAENGPTVATLAAPERPDRTVYAASELDSLPAPLFPVDLGRVRSRAPSHGFRAELVIDERGAVDAIAEGNAGTQALDAELRALLAGMVFVPARKDGRAVRSRIVLSVDPGRE